MTHAAFNPPTPVAEKPAAKNARSLKRTRVITKVPAGVGKPTSKKTALQKIIARATETFGNEARALAWLNRPSSPLRNRTPRSLIGTGSGFRQVEDLLGRIDRGIAA
jgi:putative toxin-antitoxin system antitoxin component (TIGR02293 family)